MNRASRVSTALARFDIDEIKSELRVESIVDRYGLEARRRSGRWLLRECPRCRRRASRQSVSVSARTGNWIHHGHEREVGGECSGDIIALVAACEGWDMRPFGRLLERCAEIAGITADTLTTEERAQRAIARQQADEARRRRDAQREHDRRQLAILTAPQHWYSLHRAHVNGCAYARSRGIEPSALWDDDLIRFSDRGDVAVPMFTADGHLVNVATRRREERTDAPKVLVLRDHPAKGTMIGSLPQIRHGRDVVIVEGVFDALTARFAWPNAVILGANGAGRIPTIAEAAARRVKLAGTRLLLVPDDDEQGTRAMTTAGELALEVGLVYQRSLLVVHFPHKDLNEAWVAGWRPNDRSYL